jgi:hypothetical protein
VKFVSNPDAALVDGYEIIRSTLSGKSPAQIKGLGYVAFKRATVSSLSYIDGEPLLFDLCVARKSLKEDIPDKYLPLEKDVSLTMSLGLSSDLIFACRILPAMGLCNLGYKPATIDRFPAKVWPPFSVY